MKFLAVALVLAMTLTGCGRKGAPSPPGPATSVNYPRAYPSQ